jgi:hypothetical protein
VAHVHATHETNMPRSCFHHALSVMHSSRKVITNLLSFWRRSRNCWMGNIVQLSGRVRPFRYGSRGGEMTTTSSPVRIACVHFQCEVQRKKSTRSSTHLVSTAKRR